MISPTQNPNFQFLHGHLDRDGFRLQLLSGIASRETRLDNMLEPDTLVLIINLGGASLLINGEEKRALAGQQLAIVAASGGTQWWGFGRQRALVLEVRVESLTALGGGSGLRGTLQAVRKEETSSHLSISQASMGILSLAQQLCQPPAYEACLPVWHQAKALELMSLAFFSPNTPAKARADGASVNNERVKRAVFLLERDLENPPTLEMLAAEVGCGAFQLSRMFGAQMGMSIPEFLRRHRMEKAAVLLKTSRESVSDIALMVGYTSFSAFTRGFVREFGMAPSVYRKQQRSAS